VQHLFYDKTTKQLLELKTGFLATLKNPRCKALAEPVNDTISQINTELKLRGIHSLKTEKATA
jgi:hypothetical protein